MSSKHRGSNEFWVPAAGIDRFVATIKKEHFERWMAESGAFRDFIFSHCRSLQDTTRLALLRTLVFGADHKLACRAAQELGDHQSKSGDKVLESALRDSRAETRMAGLKGCAYRGPSFLVPNAENACADSDSRVKQLAKYLLKALPQPSGESRKPCPNCGKDFSLSRLDDHISSSHTTIAQHALLKTTGSGNEKPQISRNGDTGDLAPSFWEWDMTTPNTGTYRR